MTLYAFGFAAFLFTAVPADIAGAALHRAFPLFNVFMIVTAVAASASLWAHDPLAGALMAFVALTTVPSRQLLMPAINRATDKSQRQRFTWPHGLSEAITLARLAAVACLLV